MRTPEKQIAHGHPRTLVRDDLDLASSTLARRVLFVTLSLALAGAGLGLVAARLGMVAGRETILVLCSLLFSSAALVILIFFSSIALQTVATVSTVFFALNLCLGIAIVVSGSGEKLNLFVYLLWFFPLLVFNKLVNQPQVGRWLARVLLVAPMLFLFCLLPRMRTVLRIEQQVLLAVYCLSYCAYALTLNIVTRYREKYIMERERVESLKIETQVLESISDCFISLDSRFRLVYLNDAACTQFGVARQAALNDTLSHAAPAFLSESMMVGLQAAAGSDVASIFEAQNEVHNLWYDLRCFPRPGGISIYFRDITKRKADEARIQYLAFYDVLTGLPNRQLLLDRLSQTLAAGPPTGSIGALLYIDLNDFKTLNDTLGHDIGDELLQRVALRLAACVQPSDIVARIGGDEFAVMLESLSDDAQAASAVAALVGERLLGIFPLTTHESEAKASIGATLFSGASDSVDDLLKQTNLAMYHAKAQGGNGMRFFDPMMQTDVDARSALRSDLRRAVQTFAFELHYQPQVHSDWVVAGAEVLLRWHHPLRGWVPPNEFIPLAEEAGLIGELGRLVLEKACLQLAEWANSPQLERLTVAVNVSVRQLLDPHFVNLVREVLRFSGANPHRLKLEITESSVMEKVDEMIAKMNAIKVYGVGFSLDDFGTGYSSLSHLRHLPLDQLKIDRSFVNNVLLDEKDTSIARTIIALGRNLNLSVIAEGVESLAQRDFLEAEGCHLYQGFLFGRALTVSRFEAYVSASMAAKAQMVPALSDPMVGHLAAND